MGISQLKAEYELKHPVLDRFRLALKQQIEELLLDDNYVLGVPIESRVKDFESLSRKIETNNLKIDSVLEVLDIVGIRTILLFSKDLERVKEIISKTFVVTSEEDTGTRLSENQFGYQSFHYTINLPKTWLGIPSFRDFAGIPAEIQVRTVAQHIWAAASHELQYKNEKNVPPTIRRAIHRVSALLETVDLEFDRVLQERQQYLSQIKTIDNNETLNVDLLAKIMSEMLPNKNKTNNEDYSDLLDDMFHVGVDKVKKLEELWTKRRSKILLEDATTASKVLKNKNSESDQERYRTGAYYTHVGLIRTALYAEFPEFKKYRSAKLAEIRKKNPDNSK